MEITQESKYRAKLEKLLDELDKLKAERAVSQAKYSNGQILQNVHGRMIRVDTIKTPLASSIARKLPPIQYSGPELTKKGIPRKDGTRGYIMEYQIFKVYDENMNLIETDYSVLKKHMD